MPGASKVDDHTVKIMFPTPNGLFLQGMCSAGGYVLARPQALLSTVPRSTDGRRLRQGLGRQLRPSRTTRSATPTGRRLTAWKVTSAARRRVPSRGRAQPVLLEDRPGGPAAALPRQGRLLHRVRPRGRARQVLNGQVDIHLADHQHDDATSRSWPRPDQAAATTSSRSRPA